MHKTRDFFDINQNNWRISLQLRSTESFSHFAENEMKMKDKPTATIPYKFIIFFSFAFFFFIERGAQLAFSFPIRNFVENYLGCDAEIFCFGFFLFFYFVTDADSHPRSLSLCVDIPCVCAGGKPHK